MAKTNNKQEGGSRYAYLLSDATFKVVICTPAHEKLLIEILQLLIPGKEIESISFVNKEMHGLVVSEKNVTFDLLCKEKVTGEEFLVEVQNKEQESFCDRMLVYSTYPIREQMEIRAQLIREGKVKDPMDYSLKPIYVLSMINFCLDHKSEDAIEDGYVSRYELRNQHNGELMTGSLNFVFLELGRLKLKETEPEKCRSQLERFVFSLKYMHTLKAKPDCFEEELFGDLFEATELATMTVNERQKYDSIMWTEIDKIATTNFAVKQAEARGREEGREEGRIEDRKEVIQILEQYGVSPEVIDRLRLQDEGN